MNQRDVIAVTGATGRVGRQVAERLLSAGRGVRAGRANRGETEAGRCVGH
jgi:uncharacterized protein YbjT (DUF2867 family)